jgi:hypothetical protein
MKRPTLPGNCIRIAVAAAVLSLCSLPYVQAQDAPPPQGTSRGENFSAKPPAQLFATDCTGSGCHKGPQGLGKNAGIGLASFLREHYTNSRESAAALAGYLSRIPSGPEPRDARAPRPAKPVGAAAATTTLPTWGEGGSTSESRPTPNDPRASRQQPAGRTSRATARPDDEPGAAPPAPPVAAPPAGEAAPGARAQRGRPPAATAAAAAAPPPPPEPEPAPPPPPAPKQFDIFD